MHISIARPALLGVALACLFTTGCPWGNSGIELPDIDPSASAARAIEQYDKDGDGAIAGDELDASPALKKAIKQFDTDEDKRITEAEIEARLNEWLERGFGVTQLAVQVNYRGRPLPEATVVFEPEEFLGDAIKPAEGVTSPDGNVTPSVAEEHRPIPTIPGMMPGLYRVRISKQVNGREIVPEKYNTETTLGQEVAPGAEGIQRGGSLVFSLTK